MFRNWPTPVALALGGLLFLPHPARAAETWHTCTGFIDSAPATISSQGVWCLSHDLANAVQASPAITIAANNVTIDCNGFKVSGPLAGFLSVTLGIQAANRQNAVVRNCDLRGFGIAIDLGGGGGHLVEDNRVLQANTYGIHVHDGGHNRVRRNRVYAVSASRRVVGIRANADIAGNLVTDVSSYDPLAHNVYDAIGIESLGVGNTVSGNEVSGVTAGTGAGAYGILAAAASQDIVDNRIDSGGSAVAGAGIAGNDAQATHCARNSTIGFATAISACYDAGGNISN